MCTFSYLGDHTNTIYSDMCLVIGSTLTYYFGFTAQGQSAAYDHSLCQYVRTGQSFWSNTSPSARISTNVGLDRKESNPIAANGCVSLFLSPRLQAKCFF